MKRWLRGRIIILADKKIAGSLADEGPATSYSLLLIP